jgi:hypothetical protein
VKNLLTEALMRMKDRTFHLHFATEQIARWARDYMNTRKPSSGLVRILDIGLGSARDSTNRQAGFFTRGA